MLILFAFVDSWLACVGPFLAVLKQSGVVGQNFQTLQVFITNAGGAVDILEDFVAMASAADPTGFRRISSGELCML